MDDTLGMKGLSSPSFLWTSRSFDMRVEMMTTFHHVVEQQQCDGEATFDTNTDRLDKLDKNDKTWNHYTLSGRGPP